MECCLYNTNKARRVLFTTSLIHHPVTQKHFFPVPKCFCAHIQMHQVVIIRMLLEKTPGVWSSQGIKFSDLPIGR